jgi:ribosomal protein S18 acetylase RimI-like enzyme
MARLSAETFGETPEEARHMIESAFRDENRHNFLAFSNGELIGIGGVNTGEPELYIFGLGIAPRLQNKGYGRIMLAQLIGELQKTYGREIVLEVDSENARAFHLYTTSGFEVRTQYDYYEARTAGYITEGQTV